MLFIIFKILVQIIVRDCIKIFPPVNTLVSILYVYIVIRLYFKMSWIFSILFLPLSNIRIEFIKHHILFPFVYSKWISDTAVQGRKVIQGVQRIEIIKIDIHYYNENFYNFIEMNRYIK